jgi:WD40-like Beta Propeller Repeat
VRLGAALGVAAVALVLGASGTSDGRAAAASRLRILYASDWVGPTQIFAADPSGRAPPGQLTFARPDAGQMFPSSSGSCTWVAACGYTAPLPSPDGRRLAYWSGGSVLPRTLWLAGADGSGARAIAKAGEAAWAPDSRRLAYSVDDTIHVLTLPATDRVVVDAQGGVQPRFLRFSPDGRSLAYVGVAGLTVLRGGRKLVLAPPPSAPKNGVQVLADAWEPDGRRIAYATTFGVFLVPAAGGKAVRVHRFSRKDMVPFPPFAFELAFAPDGRHLAVTISGAIRILDLRTRRAVTIEGTAHDLAWSPDGKRLLYVQGFLHPAGDEVMTGDIRTVTPAGRVRTVVAASRPYGGQILAAAWTTEPRGVAYRRPQQVDGIFAGGPVQELAADGGRVAFLECGGVSAWTLASGDVTSLAHPSTCLGPLSRAQVHSVALAGDRVAWIEKSSGLCYLWNGHDVTLGGPDVTLGHGTGCIGGPPSVGIGTTMGGGPLLVLSSWTLHNTPGGPVVDEQTVERVDPAGCPCTPISSTPGPYTVLDVDAGRIVASGDNETRILAADGTILLSLRVPTLAAQLSGSDLVVGVGGGLRVYDAGTGALRATWPLPAGPVGHDCSVYGDPSCTRPVQARLGGLARGLAVYTLDGVVRVVRISDGVDTTIGPGSLPRFTDAGLVYADGARIRLVPFDRLSLG